MDYQRKQLENIKDLENLRLSLNYSEADKSKSKNLSLRDTIICEILTFISKRAFYGLNVRLGEMKEEILGKTISNIW